MADFTAPNLAAEIEKLSPSEIDELSFGAVRLDAENRVTFFSKAESKLSGYGDRPVMGRIFFSEIAPCMGTGDFAGRIDSARARGLLNLEFGWVGDFSDPKRDLRVRIQSASGGGIWIFLMRGG